MDEFREFLAGLPGKMSQKKMDAIVEHVEAMLPPDTVKVVELIGARLGVESVRAYGLDIALDAHGNAVAVMFPNPAEVTE